jgi:heme A synthase
MKAMVYAVTFAIIMILLTALCIWGYRRAPRTAAAKKDRRLRKTGLVMLGLLVVQFFAGMVVNLWVTIPKQHPGTNPSDYFSGVMAGITWAIARSGIVALVIHVAVALLLLALGAFFLALSIYKQNRFWIVTHGAGAFFILGALFNGASFLNYGEQFSSLFMVTFFALAIATYIRALYNSKPLPKP